MNSIAISGSELHKKLMLPVYAFVAYIYITFLLAVVGPFEYLTLHPAKVFLYLTYIMACFVAGYRFSFSKTFARQSLVQPGRRVWILVGIALGVVTTSYVVLHAGSSGSLVAALADPGTAYREVRDAARIAAKESADVSLVGQIQTVTYGLTMCAVAAVFVGKKTYPRWMVLFALSYPLSQIVLAIKLGTFKLAGDWLIFALTLFSLSEAKAVSRRNKVLGILAIAIFLGAHMYSQESRKMAYGAALGFPNLHETIFRGDNVVAEILGPVAYDELASPIFYATNGYAGLSASLDQDFVWTYGLGNSMALQSYASEYFNIDVFPDTYMARAEAKTGWPALMYWPTIFPWIASDITFAGCGVLFALIGFIYPRIFYRAYISRCPLSTALLFYLNVLLVFVPCNNQLMQMRQQMIAFVGTLLAYWFATRIIRDKAYGKKRGQFPSAPGVAARMSISSH